jgi:hypothetical protein
MFKTLWSLWGARKGFRWSLYFVHREEGLCYALHENAVILLLGYVLAPIENGKHISDDWTLHISFNQKNKSIQLSETDFPGGAIAPALLTNIDAIDPGWRVETGKPVFVNVKSGANLPLGVYGATFQNEREKLQSIENLLSGVKSGTSLETVMRQVFVRV